MKEARAATAHAPARTLCPSLTLSLSLAGAFGFVPRLLSQHWLLFLGHFKPSNVHLVPQIKPGWTTSLFKPPQTIRHRRSCRFRSTDLRRTTGPRHQTCAWYFVVSCVVKIHLTNWISAPIKSWYSLFISIIWQIIRVKVFKSKIKN